jgi:hypothetical protein
MKRFSDTQRMDEAWYCDMSLEQRALFELIWAKADQAGVWSVNLRLAEHYVGKKLNWQAFLTACGGRVIGMTNGRVRLLGFIETNYGKLSRNCPPHSVVFKALEKHGLDDFGNDPAETLATPLPTPLGSDLGRPLPTILDKDKDEYTDKDKTPPAREKARGTVEELVTFCAEIGLPASDAEATFHKWQGNGWKNGQAPIKDWQATIRSWKAAGYMPSQKAFGGIVSPAAKAARKASEYPENITVRDLTPPQ